MKKYKVMQFIHGITMGGAETLVKGYVTMLSPEFESIVVTTDRDSKVVSANEQTILEQGIRIISIGQRLNMNKFFNRVKYKFLKKIRIKDIEVDFLKIVQEENPDCIHIHLALLEYIENIIDELDGIKLVYTCHSSPQRVFGAGAEHHYKIAKKLVKDGKLEMIALHEGMREELNTLFNTTNTKVVNNGIDLTSFDKELYSKSRLRKRLGIKPHEYVVGHVGRFHPVKNHSFLIEVFEEINNLKKDAVLLLIGDGPDKNKIIDTLKNKGLVEKCIILENRNDIPELMQCMDVFIFPSIIEGLGLAIVEAQASGLRAIVSGGVPTQAVFSEDAVILELNLGPSLWAKTALDTNTKNTELEGRIEEFDMKVAIKELEKIYTTN